jgi:hypothetical protein
MPDCVPPVRVDRSVFSVIALFPSFTLLLLLAIPIFSVEFSCLFSPLNFATWIN